MSALAVNVTEVPGSKFAEQVSVQLIPAGLLVTVPPAGGPPGIGSVWRSKVT